jgi:hypothetical protein
MSNETGKESMVGPTSILVELDGSGWAWIDTGPALHPFVRTDRVRSILLHFVNLARANLNTVPAALAFILIDNRNPNK